MEIIPLIKALGQTIFGLFSITALAWLIKILTDINKNQKEQIQLLREQFAEREKTREQHINFLEDHHKKEKFFIENQRDSLIKNIEAEKAILEQRMLFHEEQLNYSKKSITEKIAIKTEDKNKMVEGTIDFQNNMKNEDYRQLSQIFSHNIRSQLRSIIPLLNNSLESNKFQKFIRDMNQTGHLIGAVSDEGLKSIEKVKIISVIEKAIEGLEDKNPKITINENVKNLPPIFTDPSVLVTVFSEVLQNATVHSVKPEVEVHGRLEDNFVVIGFSNEVQMMPPEKIANFSFKTGKSMASGYGLYFVQHLTKSLSGALQYHIDKKDKNYFTIEIKLPIQT